MQAMQDHIFYQSEAHCFLLCLTEFGFGEAIDLHDFWKYGTLNCAF